MTKGDSTPVSWIVQLLYYLAALGYKSHYHEDQRILKRILNQLNELTFESIVNVLYAITRPNIESSLSQRAEVAAAFEAKYSQMKDAQSQA